MSRMTWEKSNWRKNKTKIKYRMIFLSSLVAWLTVSHSFERFSFFSSSSSRSQRSIHTTAQHIRFMRISVRVFFESKSDVCRCVPLTAVTRRTWNDNWPAKCATYCRALAISTLSGILPRIWFESKRFSWMFRKFHALHRHLSFYAVRQSFDLFSGTIG